MALLASVVAEPAWPFARIDMTSID